MLPASQFHTVRTQRAPTIGYTDRMRKRKFIAALLPFYLASTAGAESPAVLQGQLQHKALIETSGLARSPGHADRYWALNDSGNKPVLYAIDGNGESHGTIEINGGTNRDWEDLDSFKRDGKNYLVIADIGDNNGVRSEVRLIVVEEPTELPGTGNSVAVDVAWQVRVKYRGGGRDAESIAVADDTVYILTKRTLPPELYAAPLRPGHLKPITLAPVGVLTTIPGPTVLQLADAPRKRQFGWQPTAMSFTSDGTAAVVLTPWRAYLFQRDADTPWIEALDSAPKVVALPPDQQLEAVCFDREETGLLLAPEGRHAPVFHLALP